MEHVRLTPLIAALVFSLVILSPAAGWAKEADAGDFLKSLSREASTKLAGDELSQVQKEENFRALFHSAFDLPAISRFVLGKYWRRASDEQRQAFMEAFADLHMRRFLPLFQKFSHEAIDVGTVLAEGSKPNLFNVSSQIQRDQGEAINVVWRIRDTGEAYKVLDIVAEGVSMVISLRHEYGAVAKAHGVDGLIEKMRQKDTELSAQ